MRLLFLVALSVFVASCHQKNEPVLNIAVAANAQFAFAEITDAFEDQYQIRTAIIIGSSGQLTSQIEQGAPYHLFFSANMKYPDYLVSRNLTTGKSQIYAYGELVLWSTRKDLQISVDMLDDPGIKKIAIANPKNAPYGEAAINVLHASGMYEKVKDKLVFGESISQTTQFISSGAADLGFIASSIMTSPQVAGRGVYTSVSHDLYTPIAQGGVLIKQDLNHIHESAELFWEFIYSEQAQGILQNWGYRIATKSN